MFYTYVLKSTTSGKHYVGSTENLILRLGQHNSHRVASTKSGAPWTVEYYEAYLTKYLAQKGELFYKTGQGRRLLKKKLEI